MEEKKQKKIAKEEDLTDQQHNMMSLFLLLDTKVVPILAKWRIWWHEGTGKVTKTDKFSEQFQTAFDPPPLF